MTKEKKTELIAAAIRARGFSYAPYSRFNVGAALLTKGDKVYTGCNIESAAFTPTCCAERTAFFKAVSEGERDFVAIAVVGGPEDADVDQVCPPCGVCRQVMMDFCDPDEFIVILAGPGGIYREFKLRELIPLGFGPANLAAAGTAGDSCADV